MNPLFEQRAKVNGKFLPNFSGKPVSILGNIIKIDESGSSIQIKTTDNLMINVILSEPTEDYLWGWIEVRGTGQGKNHVIAQHILPWAKECTQKFDPEVYDEVITLINTINNPFVPNN